MRFHNYTMNQTTKLISRLAVLVLSMTYLTIAEASVYNVSARFSDGGVQGETLFNGQFDWDGSNLSNFSGSLTQAMWAWDELKGEYASGSDSAGNIGAPPVLNLMYQLDAISAPDADGDITASLFLLNDTNVFMNGGYTTGHSMKYGFFDGNSPNENAYFTLVFNAADPANTTTALDKIVYGDATPFGLMGPLLTGPLAMTGHSNTIAGTYGSMGGMPTDLNISAVPVPTAVWLFGTAIAGLLGVSRKRNIAA